MSSASPVDRHKVLDGRYELLGELGRGGMATVYLARHITLDRKVALKEMRATEDSVRFLREARIGGALKHPNIVAVDDSFEVDGIPYIAMEYLPQGSLRQRPRPFTVEQFCGVMRDVLAGLAAAEQLEIVHRDLKPANLLISQDGGVKIADFGIAKALGGSLRDDSRLTSGNFAMGTPQYMAPEQVEGVDDIGPAADLYAVGVIAYEMLTGDVPLGTDTTPLRVLMRRASEPPPDPATALPGLDTRLSTWVRHMLATRPGDRPVGAADAWHELEPVAVALGGPDWADRASLLRAPEPDEPTGYITFHPPPPLRPEPQPELEEADVSQSDGPPGPSVSEGRRLSDSTGPLPLIIAPLPGPGVPEHGEPELTVDAGGQAELAVRVRNQGDTVAAYGVLVEGVPDDWWTAAPEHLHLNPWGSAGDYEGTMTVRFHPPHDAQATAGRRALQLRVRRCDGQEPAVEASLTLWLTVLPFHQLEARLRPEELAGRFHRRFYVDLDNKGNSEEKVVVALSDTRAACRFRTAQRTTVAPGQQCRIECEIWPHRIRWFGRPLLHSVIATANAERLNGRFTQMAIFPLWLLTVIALLLVSAATAGALMLSPGPVPTPTPVPSPSSSSSPHDSVTPGPSNTPTSTVRVPNVVGETLSEAKGLIRDRGLDLGKVTPDLPTSTPVRSQSPAAGDEVESGSSVDIILKSIRVPDLSGLTEQEADDRLEKLDLGDGVADPWDAGVEATVRTQDPPPGERVAPGKDVKLKMAEPSAPRFGGSDANDVAAAVADQYLRGGGITDAAAQTCRSAGAQQWSCAIDITYQTESGDSECQVWIAVTPTTDLSGIETSSGLYGAYRETNTNCPSG